MRTEGKEGGEGEGEGEGEGMWATTKGGERWEEGRNVQCR